MLSPTAHPAAAGPGGGSVHPEPPESSRLAGGFVVPGHDVPVADEILTNPRAERVKAVRALAGRSVRQRAGRFVVEGPQSVREAVLAARRARRVRHRGSAQRYPEIVDAARERHVRVHLGTAEVLDAMSPDAQEVVAVAALTAHTLGSVLADAPGSWRSSRTCVTPGTRAP